MADNLTLIDRKLVENVTFVMGVDDQKKVAINFQFPPKILSDNRGGTWDDIELPGSQPISIWKTSGARKWTLEWTYVIGVLGWDVDRVRKEITNLRSYYEAREDLANNFIVQFKIWKLGGPKLMTCRLGNIDVSHGKALFIPTDAAGQPDYNSAHPVITNIKAAMQLWTKGGNMGSVDVSGEFGGFASDKNAATAAKTAATAKSKLKIEVQGLAEYAPIEWQ